MEKASRYQKAQAIYQYDGLGNRIGRTQDGILEQYILDYAGEDKNLLEIQKEIIGLGALAGGLPGGISNVLNGSGSFVNGYIGGLVNGGITGWAGKRFDYYIGNAAGGGVGSILTDILNNFDLPEAEKKSTMDIIVSAASAAGVQSTVGGILDTFIDNMDLPADTAIDHVVNTFINYVKGTYGVTSGVLGGIATGKFLSKIHSNSGENYVCE